MTDEEEPSDLKVTIDGYSPDAYTAREKLMAANAFQIARGANPPFEPDNIDSDASNFFKDCRDRALEAWDYVKREDEDHQYDSMHEVADGSIPHQTYKRWTIFVELGGYQDPDPDGMGLVFGENDFSDVPVVFLYAMAWRITTHVYEKMGM